MKELLAQSAYLAVLLSLGTYYLGSFLQKKWNSPLINPLLISVVLTIVFLVLTKIDYETYYENAKILTYFLTPVTICMAVPLYEQLTILKKNMSAILLGILSGVLTSLVSIFLLSLLFHLDHTSYVNLLPKSITTAIGMSLSEELGGIPAITVSTILITGITGNIVTPLVLRLFRIQEPIAKGIGIGTASHAIGTAKALEMGNIEGAMSGLSIAIAGFITVVFAPFFAQFL